MARYCWSLTQANDTLVTHNAIPPNRQPDSVNKSPGITRSPSKTQTQRYRQGPSTRPLGRKTKPSSNTRKRISQQGRIDALAALLLHLSYSYAKSTDPSDSVLNIVLWTVSQYQTSTHYHLSVSYLTRQEAETGLQGCAWKTGTTLLG